MILSKIKTFFELSKTLFNVLNRNEKNNFFSYLVLSVLNTFLELVSISVIILMLFNASNRNQILMKTNDITHYLVRTS